jgi:AcrR family transcriptional regulator
LYEAGLVGFAERGYHGVSVRDLTDAVGIRAQSFYAHYGSKEALLFEIVQRGMDRHRAMLTDALLQVGTSPSDQLAGLVRAHVQRFLDEPLVAIVVLNELHALSPTHQSVALAGRREIALTFVRVIERGIEAGEFSCDPWTSMTAIAGMSMSLAWWYRTPTAQQRSSPRSGAGRNLEGYPQPTTDTPDAITADFARYALRIVGASRRRSG